MNFRMKLVESQDYRIDIDGLRALAVLAVIFFHFGYLSNGFLGVDVFFVLSGYLITGIIYKNVLKNSFVLIDFFIRRGKRILPLVSFVSFFSLTLGYFVMLPDDLENLAQSVIATNFFNNNTLALLTTKDYWDVVNDFKPLMHTWSLAIEEQFYFIYPFIFIIIRNTHRLPFKKTLILVLFGLTFVSILLYVSSFEQYLKFYFLPFRFFEFSVGGLVAILSESKVVKFKYPFVFVIILIIILFSNFLFLKNFLILLTIIFTSLILLNSNQVDVLYNLFLKNRIIVFVGKLSFSLYMWHQVVLAFYRYIFVQDAYEYDNLLIFTIILFLSVLSYFLIEYNFRYNLKNSIVLIGLLSLFIISSIFSLNIYLKSGVIRDVPELNLKVNSKLNVFSSEYNDRIYRYDRDFVTNNKVKILIIGNSFARDWANILLESKYSEQIEISYIYDPFSNPFTKSRSSQADYIFVSSIDKPLYSKLAIGNPNVWCVGTKNFGSSMGYFYNHREKNCSLQRTIIDSKYIKINNLQKAQWGSDRYIDLIGTLIDENMEMPVFTPNCKFISEDTRHLTKWGAIYLSSKIETEIAFLDNND